MSIAADHPLYDQAVAIRAATIDQARRDHVPVGVTFAGLGGNDAIIPSVEGIIARLETKEAFQAAWRKSPQARIYGAIIELENLSWALEADELRGFYRRSLSDISEPADPAVVGAMITILNRVDHSEARACIDALAELLLETQRRAA